MNYQYLDDLFLLRFPNGLEDEEFVAMAKKHKSSDKILEMIKSEVDLASFYLEDSYHLNINISLIIKMVTRSTMVSVFEKLALKNYLADAQVHQTFLVALANLIQNINEENFNEFVYVLNMRKNELNRNVATWPLVTFFLLYFHVNDEIFIKPSTVKKIGKLLEYDLQYVTLPNYATYRHIKKMVMTFKEQSTLVSHKDNVQVQAVMYCAIGV